MTRSTRRAIMKEALLLSYGTGKLTFALIKGDAFTITHDKEEASRLIREKCYRLYAKCKDGHLVNHWDE